MLLRNVLLPLGIGQIENPLAGGVGFDSLYHLGLILRRFKKDHLVSVRIFTYRICRDFLIL
jgi:hypothetical protein